MWSECACVCVCEWVCLVMVQVAWGSWRRFVLCSYVAVMVDVLGLGVRNSVQPADEPRTQASPNLYALAPCHDMPHLPRAVRLLGLTPTPTIITSSTTTYIYYRHNQHLSSIHHFEEVCVHVCVCVCWW